MRLVRRVPFTLLSLFTFFSSVLEQSGEKMTVMIVDDIQFEVGSVKIRGLKKTKADIVAEQVKHLLQAKNFQELVEGIQEARMRFADMEVFKSVDVVIDTVRAKNGREQSGEDKSGKRQDEKVAVVFQVQESRSVQCKLGVEAGTQSGGTVESLDPRANLSMSLRNVFGRAEQLQLTSGASLPHWGYSCQLQFTKPYYKDLTKRLLVSAGTTENKIPTGGYQEYTTGGIAQVSFLSRLGQHSLSLNCLCRNNCVLGAQVPMSVREEAGYSLKSSIKHVLDWDNTDGVYYPVRGYQFQMTNEVAGLGGDSHFSKMEVQSQYFKEIIRDCVVSLSLWGGFLNPLTPSRVNDRFLLGGPTTLRGFGLWGAGPQDQGFAIGGEAYWASGLHLFTPLPLVSRRGIFELFRLHGFVTVGNSVRKFSFSRSMLQALANDVRVSCGLGLCFKLNSAEIEFNYAVPVRATPNDQLNPGLQVGIGLRLL